MTDKNDAAPMPPHCGNCKHWSYMTAQVGGCGRVPKWLRWIKPLYVTDGYSVCGKHERRQ